jgi:hypothetical protein
VDFAATIMSVLCGGGGKRLQVAQCFLKTDRSQLGHKTKQVCDVQRKLVKTKKPAFRIKTEDKM